MELPDSVIASRLSAPRRSKEGMIPAVSIA